MRQEWWGANRRWQCVFHFSASFDPTWNARLHGEDGSRRAGKSASLQRCSTEPPPVTVTVTVTAGGPSPGPDATFPAPPTPLFPPDAHAHAHRQLRMRKLTFLPLLLLPFSLKKKKKEYNKTSLECAQHLESSLLRLLGPDRADLLPCATELRGGTPHPEPSRQVCPSPACETSAGLSEPRVGPGLPAALRLRAATRAPPTPPRPAGSLPSLSDRKPRPALHSCVPGNQSGPPARAGEEGKLPGDPNIYAYDLIRNEPVLGFYFKTPHPAFLFLLSYLYTLFGEHSGGGERGSKSSRF